MKIKEKSTEEKVIRKYLLRLRQPRIKKKENRYYIRGYKGTEVIIRTDHEILKRIAYRRTCVKQVCIPGRYETETKYIYTRKENRRSRPVIVPGIPTGRETAMPRAVRTVLHALSYGGIEVEASRKLADLKKMDPMRIFYRTLDAEVYNGDYKVPIRLFFPTEEDMENGAASGKKPPVILFFHGGGWVTESVENYQRVCARMAQSTGQIVASVEYRLAPEYRFPVGLMDCYAAAKTFYTNRFLLNTDPDRITIMGDSAGGNLAAAVCMMARDRGDFFPKKQILIYPALNNCYTEDSPFESVQTNGTGYLLTAETMEDYLKFYESCPEDRRNPYFAPILEKNFRNMPDTLILTAEFDPLRDEGEAFGEKLKEAGNRVEVHRIAGAFHGYFALGIKFLHVQESFAYVNRFLETEEQEEGKHHEERICTVEKT